MASCSLPLWSVGCNAVWVSCSWDLVLLKLHFLLLLCSSPEAHWHCCVLWLACTESILPFSSLTKIYLISLKSLDWILNTSTYTEIIRSALFKKGKIEICALLWTLLCLWNSTFVNGVSLKSHVLSSWQTFDLYHKFTDTGIPNLKSNTVDL